MRRLTACGGWRGSGPTAATLATSPTGPASTSGSSSTSSAVTRMSAGSSHCPAGGCPVRCRAGCRGERSRGRCRGRGPGGGRCRGRSRGRRTGSPACCGADPATDRWDRVEQRKQLRDVVAVAAGQQDCERGALPVGDQMVLRAGPAPVDRRGARMDPPFNALTWEESTTHRDQSNRDAAFNSASRTSCSRCHTPASFYSCRRRQHVLPEPNPNSCGRYSHWILVCSTDRIPHSTSRSGNALRPGYRNLRSRCGSSGSRRSRNSSDTIHDYVPTPDRTLNTRASHGSQDRSTSLC